MESKEYRISEGGFKALRNKTLLITVPVVVLGMAIGFTIAHFNTTHEPDDINVLPYIIPVVAIIMGFNIQAEVQKLNKTILLTLSRTMRLQYPECLYIGKSLCDVLVQNKGAFSYTTKLSV